MKNMHSVKKTVRITLTLLALLMSATAVFPKMYLTNETNDTTVEVSFHPVWSSITGSTQGTTRQSFIVEPHAAHETPKTGSYDNTSIVNHFRFTVTGPDADKVKIFGLSGEQYVAGQDGYFVNANTGVPIEFGTAEIWRFWAKKV